MNIININRKTMRLVQSGLNVLGFVKYWAFDRNKYRKYIAKNKDLKGIANGNSCYILGNGPSLKKVDLTLLKGKNIITVNKSVCTSIFSELNPVYHVVIDRFILEDIADDIEKELMRKDSDTIFILHRSGIERFAKYDRARFVYGTKMASSQKAVSNKMTENMTTFLNVLPFAVLCMTYIGFNKIILLGNDFSFFAARKDQHFYDIEDNKVRTETLYSDLAGCSIVLLEYKSLYEFANKKGIEIVNATEGSLLDEIPQVKLQDYV